MNENLPEDPNQVAIFQQDELRNNHQHMQQQQNSQEEVPAVISQENRTQINNNNRRQRMKWTKTLNTDIIRCYFETVLRIPNQPYRKQFHNRWTALHPELQLSEQRISDQHRTIMSKVNTRENTRGSWLTEIEIQEIQNTILTEIEGERNQPENLPIDEPDIQNNIYNAPAAPNVQPEIAVVNDEIPAENHPDEDEIAKIKEALIDNYAYSIITPFEERFDFKRPNKKTLKRLKTSLGRVNQALEDVTLLTEISDVNQLNNMVYAAAITAIKDSATEKNCIYRKIDKKKKKGDEWEFGIKRRIDHLRADISRISQMRDPNPSTKMKKNNNAMKQKYNITNEENREVRLETLKQRLLALNNRLSRYRKRQKQFRQNNDFIEKPSKLFDELRGNRTEINDPPSKENVEEFWKPIYETRKNYNRDAVWLQQYKDSINVVQTEYNTVTSDEVATATSKFANWKSPGIDKIQNFWWNSLPSLYLKSAEIFDQLVTDPNLCPEWLTIGRTTLVSKKQPTKNPSNYRPITCLPIIYKILSSIITCRLNDHISANNLIPKEQKGSASNTFGTIDQLIINKMIMDDAKTKKLNMSTAWIDYRKAFDSVPHDWIIDTLRIHQFDETITKFIETTMKQWKTSITLPYCDGQVKTDLFEINNGIFQGDSPSGLLFILSLLPLTWLLKRSNLGYRISHNIISHLLFMDDLKLYASNDQQLKQMIAIVKTFSDDIRMQFGIDKCNKITIDKGKVIPSENITLNNDEVLRSLEPHQQYRYLGFNERQTTDKEAKSSMKHEYFSRIKIILKSELSSKHTINAINMYAVPALSYGFPVLDWTVTELEMVDRETRKVLQTYHVMHHQSDITRLYLARKNGGRGLINIVNHFKNSIINFSSYLLSSNESYLNLVSTWQLTRGSKSIHAMAQSYCQELDLDIQELSTLQKQQRKNRINKRRTDTKIETLKSKNLHGQYMRLLEEPHIDKESSTKWLTSASLKRATESSICAIQEQAITTNYIKKHIFRSEESDLCRVCRKEKETIHHVISSCETLAPTKYLERHDNVCKYIHMLLTNEHGINNQITSWYRHKPRPIVENDRVKILWNFQVQTDHHLRHIKPDIIVVDKTKNEANIIDVAIPNDYRIAQKRLEKLRNYTDLCAEIKTLWRLSKVRITPIIIGAMGIMFQKFDKDIEKLNLQRHKFDKFEAQKIALLGTAHIVRSFSMIA